MQTPARMTFAQEDNVLQIRCYAMTAAPARMISVKTVRVSMTPSARWMTETPVRTTSAYPLNASTFQKIATMTICAQRISARTEPVSTNLFASLTQTPAQTTIALVELASVMLYYAMTQVPVQMIFAKTEHAFTSLYAWWMTVIPAPRITVSAAVAFTRPLSATITMPVQMTYA